MRKLLNTLYVTTPDAYLSKDGLNVVVSVKQVETFRIPIINIEQIVTFGYMGASPGLMKLCADYCVSLTFLSPSGRLIGHFQGPIKGNVVLRKRQYELSSQEDFAIHISRLFIAAKIKNYRSILRRAIRDNGPNLHIEEMTKLLDQRRKQVLEATDFNVLRGLEGDAANAYFSVFPHLILRQKESFPFICRNKRPPKDAVNAMLSFVYTLLANDTAAALETVGLDPYVGFLHTLRPGRCSLALDVMEEFRAYLGDRLVLSLINKGQIHANDFIIQGEDSVTMTDNGRKILLTAWQARKKEQIMHPYLNEKILIGLLPYVQSQLLARFIREDLNDYPVFLIK